MQEQRTNYWINQGINQGLSEGLSKSKHEGFATSLVNLLTDRFGTLSESHLQQINAMTDDELRQAGRRLLHVTSIEEILK